MALSLSHFPLLCYKYTLPLLKLPCYLHRLYDTKYFRTAVTLFSPSAVSKNVKQTLDAKLIVSRKSQIDFVFRVKFKNGTSRNDNRLSYGFLNTYSSLELFFILRLIQTHLTKRSQKKRYDRKRMRGTTFDSAICIKKLTKTTLQSWSSATLFFFFSFSSTCPPPVSRCFNLIKMHRRENGEYE